MAPMKRGLKLLVGTWVGVEVSVCPKNGPDEEGIETVSGGADGDGHSTRPKNGPDEEGIETKASRNQGVPFLASEEWPR